MEYWSIGFARNESIFIGLAESKQIRSELYPLLIRNIPLFHHSIIPYNGSD